jgi:hypothetical protein
VKKNREALLGLSDLLDSLREDQFTSDQYTRDQDGEDIFTVLALDPLWSLERAISRSGFAASTEAWAFLRYRFKAEYPFYDLASRTGEFLGLNENETFSLFFGRSLTREQTVAFLRRMAA